MTLLHTWLSHNSLRQAYTAFDMDTPGDMPIRPILQVLRIGASSVTMGRKKVATLKLQCTDGGMGQNSGYIFTQPDMLDPERIKEEDFELKIGSAVILLEYRVQQSPKTQMKYIRVSEMLIVDSMLHLRSETPIQCRPPVAQSQLANRVVSSGEPMEDEAQQTNMMQDVQDDMEDTTAPAPAVLPPNESNPQQPSISPQTQNASTPPQKVRSSFTSSMAPPTTQYTQFTQASPMTQVTVASHLRKTTTFGYNPSSTEKLQTLSSLFDKSHGNVIDCIAVIETVFHVKLVGSLGRSKRDLHIVDPSQSRHTILSVWRDIDTFSPVSGDIILLKRAQVHRYDGRSLNAYEYTEMVLNPERQDCVGLREWWELKELEKNGFLDDLEDDDLEV